MLRPTYDKDRDEWLEALAAEEPDGWVARDLPARDFKHEDWHQFYWDAWHALKYDRPFAGMSGMELPISYIAIDAYARRHGVEGQAFDRLIRFVSAIDFAHLEIQREAMKVDDGKNNPPT